MKLPTFLKTSAVSLAAMGLMASTAFADCAAYTGDSSTLLQPVVLAANVGETWVGSEDGAISLATFNDVRPLGDPNAEDTTTWTLADANTAPQTDQPAMDIVVLAALTASTPWTELSEGTSSS